MPLHLTGQILHHASRRSIPRFLAYLRSPFGHTPLQATNSKNLTLGNLSYSAGSAGACNIGNIHVYKMYNILTSIPKSVYFLHLANRIRMKQCFSEYRQTAGTVIAHASCMHTWILSGCYARLSHAIRQCTIRSTRTHARKFSELHAVGGDLEAVARSVNV